jgi:hypothetical protein
VSEAPLMEVRGPAGDVLLFRDRLMIRKRVKFLFFRLKDDEKEILLTSVSSIQLRKPGWFRPGFVEFAFAGGQEGHGRQGVGGLHENTVFFRRRERAQFEAIREAIYKQINAIRHLGAGAPVAQVSAADEIEKLASLKARGLLTEEEFAAKKRQILGL